MSDFKARQAALAAAAKEAGVDQTKTQTGGGGDYKPPPEGRCQLRLISYVELGKHEETFKGVTKLKDKVSATFELSGPNHQPVVGEDGTKHPYRITVEETYSLHEKARFKGLFNRLNYSGAFTHGIEAVGEAYLGRVFHRKYKKKDGTEGVAAELYSKDFGWGVEPPRFEDPVSGEIKVVNVAPPITALKGFLWNFPSKEDWASLFIEGEYPARTDKDGKVTAPAKSKNVIQAKILKAKNFKGSPLEELLVSNGVQIAIPDVEEDEVPPQDEDQAAEMAKASVAAANLTPAAKTDALNGIV